MAGEPEIIDDSYEVRSVIASGNKTQVCEVVEKGTGRHLAMKLVIEGNNPEAIKEAKADIKAEAAVAKTLLHPNIIRFEKYSTSRDATYILMEFFRAANVKAQLKSELTSLHSRARPLLEGACQALAYLHEQGWVHRDLKPENILLNRAGEVKLIDFSLTAKFSQGFGKMLGLGGKRNIQGTRTYIAPETILRKPLSPQTDIYSLGITFFEILTGKTPFQGFTPQDLLQKHLTLPPPLASAINPNLTPEVDQLLIAMMKKKPKDRPGSVQEVFAEIRRIKLFHKDVLEIQAEKQQLEHAEKMSIIAMLDSRTDAERTDLLRTNPEMAEQFDKERKQRQDRRRPKQRAPSKGLAQPTPAAAPPPAMPQPMMPQPMMPPMMMPQPMMPSYYPQGAMPGYPPGYPQMPPGYGMPQQYGMPAQSSGVPPMPVPPPGPPPAAPQPPPAAPVSQAPPAKPSAPPPVDPDSLDFMTDLPQVI